MKHAWLIIAHNEFEVLQRLVSMLDAPESDFYIHFDKKVQKLPDIRAEKGRLIVLKNRVDVRWGTVSQIRTEFALFAEAFSNAPYAYYHIISGTTLPLQTMDGVERFFREVEGWSIVTGLTRDSEYQETLKLHRYNVFMYNYTSKNKILRGVSQFLWKSAVAFQRMLNIQINAGKSFYKASNWVSLTKEAVELLLSRKEQIEKTYRWSFCGDEFFVPSELMDSPLRDKIYNYDKYLMHTIGRANASSYRLAEWDGLSKSGYLFARKFTR